MGVKTYTQIIVNQGTAFTFGKYRGKTVREVMRDDPSYIVWAGENDVALIPDDIMDEAYEKDMDKWDSDLGHNYSSYYDD